MPMRTARAASAQTAAAAFYQQAEVHRLRGEFGAAERAFRSASRGGFDPQPGLALLRLAEGNLDAAAAAIGRALGATTDRLGRARLLPACVEIMLAADDPQAAEDACGELEATAETFETDALRAMAAQARGAVQLAGGAADAALPAAAPGVRPLAAGRGALPCGAGARARRRSHAGASATPRARRSSSTPRRRLSALGRRAGPCAARAGHRAGTRTA